MNNQTPRPPRNAAAAAGSAVTVQDVQSDYVTLDLPDSPHSTARSIPQDMVEFGREARNWFLWDMETKQPRAPHKSDGYASPTQWGRDNVSWDARKGSRFANVLDELDGTVTGHCNPNWSWRNTGDEGPRDLYPMAVVPHSDFQPDDEPGLMLIDFDDVIDVQGDGTGRLSREVWDLIERLDAYAEVSSSMNGVHVFVKAELPHKLDAKKVIEDLQTDDGQIEIYGPPADGRIIGTTWMHIDGTPRHAVPERQDVIGDIVDTYVSDDDQLSDEEQAERVFERHEAGIQDDDSEPSRSAYYDLNPVPIANTGAFAVHGSGGEGPHPLHGGTSTPDADSTNFGVSRGKGWKCWAHDDGGGALQLIAVLEDIRDCGDASDVMGDPSDALDVCLAARDDYSSNLDDEKPPTVALKGVCELQNLNYSDSGVLERGTYEIARNLYDTMTYTSAPDES